MWIKSVKEVLVAYIPAILATIAVICGVASNVYCETLQFPQVSGRATLLVGVFSFRTTDAEEIDNETWVDTACQNYGWLDKDLGFDYELDAKARTAMAFAIIADLWVESLHFLVSCCRAREIMPTSRVRKNCRLFFS